MALLDNSLVVKHSTLPGAGMGLFTLDFIPKNTVIVEYKGRKRTWKEVNKDPGHNGYLYYVNRNLVIDARTYLGSKARYANDARGMKKIKGLNNNSIYIEKDDRVFIRASKDIWPGQEILVDYGKEYWETVRYNEKIERKEKKKTKKTGRKR
jgi:SET domain-containing protein